VSVRERLQGPTPGGSGLEAPTFNPPLSLTDRLDRLAGYAFLLPAVLVVMFLSIFPLIVSLYISLIRLQFVKGGFDLTFVGLLNYTKLLVGIDHVHFLGQTAPPTLLGWLAFVAVVLSQLWLLWRYFRGGPLSLAGALGRCVVAVLVTALAWMLMPGCSSTRSPPAATPARSASRSSTCSWAWPCSTASAWGWRCCAPNTCPGGASSAWCFCCP
jgi:hypothetical protein